MLERLRKWIGPWTLQLRLPMECLVRERSPSDLCGLACCQQVLRFREPLLRRNSV